jgi:hypothetical protein
VVLVHEKKTVKERWEVVVAEYSKKSAYAQTDMRAKFMAMRCPDKGNPRDFLEGLRVKKEELCQAGVVVDEKDYFSVIISSLPLSLSNFASNQLAAAQFSTRKMSPNDLLSMLLEESDRQRAQYQRRRGPGKGKDEEGEALAVGHAPKSREKERGKGKKHADFTCWNCEEQGHISRFCKKPKKPRKKDESNTAKGEGKAGISGVANAVEPNIEDGGAWAAVVDDEDWFLRAAVMPIEKGESDVIEHYGDTSGIAFVVTEPVQSNGSTELYDSGCTDHISPYRDQFENFERTIPRQFHAANKDTFSTIGKGELIVRIPNGADHTELRLSNVLYSPNVSYTLVSIGRLDENGFSALFSKGKCVLKGPDDELLGEVLKSSQGVYKIDHIRFANVAERALTLHQLHRRLGHPSIPVVRELLKDKLVKGIRLEYTPQSDDVPFFCESCVYGKAIRKAVSKLREGARATVFGGEIHSDLWGKAPVRSRGGKWFWITFIDDKTRFTLIYFLATKDEAFDAYKKFEAWVYVQMGKVIKALNTDQGGEYTDSNFKDYLKSKGTIQKLSVHDTHQQSGVAERRNRTIGERVRTFLHASGLPQYLWTEAARHAVWMLNRTTTKAVEGMTPYEAAFGKKPDLSLVQEWGEKVYVRVEKGNKLGGRVRQGRWLGVDEESKGVRVYWSDTKTVTIERNTYFDNSSAARLEGEEDLQDYETKINSPNPIETDEHRTEDPQIEDEDPERERRIRKPSQRVRDLLEGRGTWSDDPNDSLVPPGVQLLAERGADDEKLTDWFDDVPTHVEGYAFVAVTSGSEALEPQSLAEAKRGSDWIHWEKAIHEELATLRAAGTWKLVEAPAGVNIVGSKWVFRAKKDAGGKVVRYKARLVAQGFSQVPGVDYFDTFAPVARLASIRAVLAFAASENLETGQIDIKGAYLNGELTSNENIFMKQPPGYAQGNLVCKLQKTLYGLKQSGRRWYQKLVEIMTKLLFLRSEVDQAVFYRRDVGRNLLIIVLVHVDDCSIVATTQPLINTFKIEIKKHVEITDMGELHWILGIEVKRIREERKIFLSQRSYIDSILRRYGLDELKPVSIPMDTNVRLNSSQSPTTTDDIAAMRNVPYHEAVGSLMYASLGTRPDITFAVQTVSRFTANPGMAHWEAVKRIFRYLKGSRELWLSYGGEGKVLEGYADADGSMMEDRRAISGYAFIINGGAVSWSAKKQEIVSLSTTESEYIAATYAAKEALWLRSLISQLFGKTLPATTLFSDNQSAIALTKEHQYHARTKHINVRFHFIRWIVEEGKLRIIYCPTEDMVADVLTKALPSAKVKHFARELGLVSV